MGYDEDHYPRDYGFEMPDLRATYYGEEGCLTITIQRDWYLVDDEDAPGGVDPCRMRCTYEVHRDPEEGPRVYEGSFNSMHEAERHIKKTWPDAELDTADGGY